MLNGQRPIQDRTLTRLKFAVQRLRCGESEGLAQTNALYRALVVLCAERMGRDPLAVQMTDSRAKRDGKFIEDLGQYNPNTNPATIDLNFERALEWMMNGAEPSNTARAILSYKGVLMKKHLLEGVKKGALTAEQVEERFTKWLNDKQSLIDGKITNLSSAADKAKADRLKAEADANTKKAEAVAAKFAVVEEAPAAEEVAEEVAEVAAEEAPAAEAAAEEAPAAEAAAEEAPAAEAATEEAPAADAE
jgi:small subunit ribosomal protein S16